MDSIGHLRFKEEFRHYVRMLKGASTAIIDQEVSEFPIFVFHKNELPIGIPLTTPEQYGEWYVNASTLEEFVTKQLIAEEKVADFRKTYKDPTTHFCLFLVEEESAEFIFIPQQLPGEN